MDKVAYFKMSGTVIRGCDKDEIPDDLVIPDGVTEIGEGAFEDCTSLTSVSIPSSVTYIGETAFRGCTSLASMTIPNSVTTIGDGAFYGCKSLASVTYTGTKAQWEAIEREHHWGYGLGTFTVHCTDGELSEKEQ